MSFLLITLTFYELFNKRKITKYRVELTCEEQSRSTIQHRRSRLLAVFEYLGLVFRLRLALTRQSCRSCHMGLGWFSPSNCKL